MVVELLPDFLEDLIFLVEGEAGTAFEVARDAVALEERGVVVGGVVVVEEEFVDARPQMIEKELAHFGEVHHHFESCLKGQQVSRGRIRHELRQCCPLPLLSSKHQHDLVLNSSQVQ